MIAQLAMYDRPETAAATDRFWAAIRGHLGEGPERLDRDTPLWEAWQSPDLLLAQTCGLPFRSRLHPRVTLVATPDHGLPGCPPGHYTSVFVAHRTRADAALADFAGARFAYNEALSHSGWAAPRTHMDAAGLRMGTLVPTGAHRASARAVAEGRADLAGLDALTWEMIRRHDDFAADLVEIARTDPTPALPYITARNRDPEPLRTALSAAVDTLSPADRDTLHLRAIVTIPASTYLAVPTPPAP
ncbi:ABC transporter, phosphonate, substrate-binding protein [Salinihabitans flavidus]|uniref:ABC transporter, phosphonate, substrate-binding protein n=1 Tax=Salinihabitans flavidus TaxID=569882 RepID=A0A1H8RA65_9RHOB|nr:PhnD/SsuA/transferrin family substrate-binding protein [Salinihabitans flavidus]SEO63300.1 ABC transporter, phosphonate, substrate-binding protein [Salinihabitans flavidus]